MAFLAIIPPFAVFFRKQRRLNKRHIANDEGRKASSSSVEFGRKLEEEQIQEEDARTSGGRGRVKSELQGTKGFWRRRVRTIGTTNRWCLMDSCNRHTIRSNNNNTQQQHHQEDNRKMPKKRLPEKPLNQFWLVPVHGCRRSARSSRRPEFCDCCPIDRSGHRMFSDSDFVYIIGGYNPSHNTDSTFADIWRFNRLTQLWQKCEMAPESALQLPNTLASFSLIDSPHASNECYIFGGTGVPFGVAASDQLHWIRIDPRGNILIQTEQRESMNAREEGEQQQHRWNDQQNGNVEQQQPLPPKIYGHAMCRKIEVDGAGKLKEVLFLAGGTTGHIYNMDIWRLERPFGQQSVHSPWKCTQLNRNGFEIGRYRLEMTVHGHMLFTFGGGAPEFCAEFNELLAFNLSTNRFETIKTRPDPEFGLPLGRKCHALVQRDHLVYIIGGCRDAEFHHQQQHRIHQITNDVWQFNMDTLQWTRMRTNMPKPVFFHAATLTPDGCVFVFGGCTDESSQTRCNRLQRMWLQPPSLKHLASTSLINAVPEAIRQRINKEGIRLSDSEALITRIFAPSLAA